MAIVHVDTIGGSLARANWFGPKVGDHLALFCVHRMNRVHSRNGCAVMTAP